MVDYRNVNKLNTMAKTLCFSGLLWLFAAQGVFAEKNNLRGVSWGMSRFDVMASEDLSPESFDAYYIHYKTEIQGREQDLIYGFLENVLVDAVYVVTVINPDEVVLLKKNMEKKHGKPRVSNDNGKGNYLFEWENRDTLIMMKPGRLKECRIEYISKKFKYIKEREVRKAREKEENDLLWTF